MVRVPLPALVSPPLSVPATALVSVSVAPLATSIVPPPRPTVTMREVANELVASR